jgi:hypothetical protein
MKLGIVVPGLWAQSFKKIKKVKSFPHSATPGIGFKSAMQSSVEGSGVK